MATGTAVIARGALSGNRYAVRVTFDRPASAKEFGGRLLFSRLVVDYTVRVGPEGQRRQVMALESMWADARSLLDSTTAPCPGGCLRATLMATHCLGQGARRYDR